MALIQMSKNKVLVCAVAALICGMSITWASRFLGNTAKKVKLNAGRVEVEGLNNLNGTRAWQGRLAAATASAKRDLFTFKARVMDHWKDKPEIMKYYGSKPDEFFLRFLQIEEHEKNEETAGVTMVTNFAEFMNERRKEGILEGLGAHMLKDAASAGYIRVMSSQYRDAEGRRIILTKPANLNKVPSEDLRSKLYLYWFLKLSTYDDAVDPGFVIAHDLTDVSITSLVRTAMTSTAKRMLVDLTFPMNLQKIILMNYGNSWGVSALTGLFKQFAPAHTEIVYLPYATQNLEILNLEILKSSLVRPSTRSLYSHIPKASLPIGKPYSGEADEDIVAALKAGLGSLYEPEMDPLENKAE